ncbi:hypothetical protein Dimus_011886 [Dionaea muscipula]
MQLAMEYKKLIMVYDALSCMLVIFISSLSSSSFSFSIQAEAAPQNALIKQLPGFTGKFPSNHYSGYVTIMNRSSAGEGTKKYLFYYFVESERNSSKDPVVLWLNGGPGCSSFDGFVYEHGPFKFKLGGVNKISGLPTATPTATLHLNPYSWSKVSNIIYLDSPAGVGFSYSPNSTVYQTGDLQTASDTHAFLLKWFEEYPEFIKNPFYIAGESYAGIYVPTLAAKVVEGIKVKAQPAINFKGYMIGNGVVGEDTYDGNALIPFAHGMALISDDLYKNVMTACGEHYYKNDAAECIQYEDKVNRALDELNVYDILEPCYHSPEKAFNNSGSGLGISGSSLLPESFRQLGKTDRADHPPVRKRMFGRAWPYQMVLQDGFVPSWPQLMMTVQSRGIHVPCVNDEVATAWLNNASVRKAIRAQEEGVIGAWAICMSIEYNHDAGSMIKYHRNLTAQGYRALLYSGDHDMCVPYTGTQAWTSSMGYKAIDGWRPWMVNNQVAGYLQEYEHNFTFLTIKGAGHTVPEYKPRESLAFFRRWLNRKPI